MYVRSDSMSLVVLPLFCYAIPDEQFSAFFTIILLTTKERDKENIYDQKEIKILRPWGERDKAS